MKQLIKDYKVNFKGWEVVVPKGSVVSHQTALGVDENYNFATTVNPFYGSDYSTFKHDFTHYGINVPNEYLKEIKE